SQRGEGHREEEGGQDGLRYPGRQAPPLRGPKGGDVRRHENYPQDYSREGEQDVQGYAHLQDEDRDEDGEDGERVDRRGDDREMAFLVPSIHEQERDEGRDGDEREEGAVGVRGLSGDPQKEGWPY